MFFFLILGAPSAIKMAERGKVQCEGGGVGPTISEPETQPTEEEQDTDEVGAADAGDHPYGRDQIMSLMFFHLLSLLSLLSLSFHLYLFLY